MEDIIFPRYSFASLFPLEITFQDDKHIFCHFVFDVRLGVFRGVLPYERGGDAGREFWIKPVKETNLGMAQPFFEIILKFD